MAAGWVLVATAAAAGLGAGPAAAAAAVTGLDASDHQPVIDWSAVASGGARFAYIKATEGTGFVNPDFAAQYDGSYQAGLIRGAYHFALPGRSSGAAQASYFTAHGGGWSADGRPCPEPWTSSRTPAAPSATGSARARWWRGSPASPAPTTS